MDKRAQYLQNWGSWAVLHWKKALLIALVVTVITGAGFIFLKMEMTFYSILPRNSSQVKDLQFITENFPAANTIVVVIRAKQKAQVIEAITALEKEFGKPEYQKYIANTQSKLDTAFFRTHGLILSGEKDLQRIQNLFADLSLVPLLTHMNDDFEAAYTGNEQSLRNDEAVALSQVNGIKKILELMGKNRPDRTEVGAALDLFLFGEPYFLNKDQTAGLLLIAPEYTINDLPFLTEGVPLLEKAAKQVCSRYSAEAGLTGLTVVGKDEMMTAEQGLVLSSLIALLLIIGLMVLAFRMFAVPLISGIPLVIGILWTIGLTGFIIRRLNIMTAMYMIVLLGLGIDYAIHLLSTFIQELDSGKPFQDAVSAAFGKSGAGIITGALTTAAAFFALNLAESEVVKELGTVAGIGILCEMGAMFILIPALLGFRNHRLQKKGKHAFVFAGKINSGSRFMHGLGKIIKQAPLLILILFLVLTAGLGIATPNIDVEGNLMNMEAKGLESVLLQDKMVAEFEMAPDSLFIVTSDPAELKTLTDKLKTLSSIKQVDSLAPYLTTPEEYQNREVYIRKIAENLEQQPVAATVDQAALIRELYRLKDNLLEMGDLAYLGGMQKLMNAIHAITGIKGENSGEAPPVIEAAIRRIPGSTDLDAYQALLAAGLKTRLQTMANPEPVTIEQLPASIRNTYISKDGSRYLMTLVPVRNPWDEDFRKIYTEQINSVTNKATGMLLAADQMTRIARIDGIRAALLALAVIFILLLLDFRNLKLVLITLFPLLTSFTALFGFMALAGIKFDFMNFITIPLLIGIGVDDVIHINHRYLLEGKGNMDRVIARTGSAVLMTTLTTIIGFASLIPSVMRAMQSTGIVLSAAMALAFLFSILMHPAVLILLTEKAGFNFKPWQRRKS